MPAASGRRWGWHQLDSHWARRVVDNAYITPGDLVVDVGAGTGALTEALVEAGARVVAVELHPGRAAILASRFRDAPVRVVQADAADLRLPCRPFKVVSNPPFAAGMGLLKRLLSEGTRLVRADLILPSYLGRRWCSDQAPGWRRWGWHYQIGLGRPPPRRAFAPPPPGGVCLLVITRRDRPTPSRTPQRRCALVRSGRWPRPWA